MTDERRAHRERVDALLEQLADRRRRLYLLQAGGARPAGLRDAEAELDAAQRRLLEAV